MTTADPTTDPAKTDPPAGEPKSGQQDPPKSDGKNGDEPLGPPGKKALDSERERGDRLERELREFKAQQTEQTKRIAEAFGVKTDGAKPEDLSAEALKEVGNLRRELLVERLARQHHIDDDGDLELLMAASDEAAARKLAARLGKSAKDADEPKDEPKQRRWPKQDTSQGKGGSGGEGKPTSVSEVMEARRQARAAKETRSA